MTDEHLVGLSQERVVPNPDKGVRADSEQQMRVKIKVNVIQRLSVHSLHFHLYSHFFKIVPSNRGILTHNPQTITATELHLPNNLANKDLPHKPQRLQLPNINMCPTVPDQGNQL